MINQRSSISGLNLLNNRVGVNAIGIETQYTYPGLLLTEHLDYNSMAKHVAKLQIGNWTWSSPNIRHLEDYPITCIQNFMIL